MDDDITQKPVTEETPAVSSANPKPPAGVSPVTDPPAGDVETPIHLEEAKKLRSEASNLRKRLKAFEDAEEEKKLAALSDVEKANALAEQTNKKFQQYQQETEAKIKAYLEQIVAAKVKEVASSMGIIDPEIAAMAIQSSLEYDDDGMPTNIDTSLKTLIKQKPYLVPKVADPEQQAATPAQTATTARPPLTPVNNPGRSNIPTPGQTTPGKIPTWGDVYKRP